MPSNEPHRLDPQRYIGLGTFVSVTSTTKHRTPFFAREPIARDTIRIMEERARVREVHVASYCFMPDHMHIDVGASDNFSALQFIHELKSFSARASWSHGVHRTIWQRSYWDVIVESGLDGIQAAMAYTLCNPEEAGMAKLWTDYAYGGSLVYTREQLVEMVPPGTNAGRSRARLSRSFTLPQGQALGLRESDDAES